MKLFHHRLSTIFLACVLILFYNVSCKREAQETPFTEKKTEQFSTKDLILIKTSASPTIDGIIEDFWKMLLF